MTTSSTSRREMVCRLLPRRAAIGRRGGFTLIEILVVLVIISVLIGLILPALSGVWSNARIVQVRSDISTIESAIAKFKSDFNIDPPSGIVLFEQGADWSLPANATSPEVARSRALIRQMWPQYDFTINRDINRDNDATDTFTLAGGECLVFFLGGVARIGTDVNGNGFFDTGDTLIPDGFSANPANPFAAGGNRKGPYFEFVASRLIPSPANLGFMAYLDPFPGQTTPYIYISSNGGKGYRMSDLGGGMTCWYLEADSPNLATVRNAATTKAWLPTKYQIISPGADHAYGAGGCFVLASSTSTSTTGPTPEFTLNRINPGTGMPETLPINSALRAPELDNITNFHSRTLSTR